MSGSNPRKMNCFCSKSRIEKLGVEKEKKKKKKEMQKTTLWGEEMWKTMMMMRSMMITIEMVKRVAGAGVAGGVGVD